jgi:predicted Zn-dependent protease
MRDYFYKLVDEIGDLLEPDEVFICHLMGEDSDFVRFNHNRVRQAGRVRQIEIKLDLIEGTRHAAATFTVSGEMKYDSAMLRDRIKALRILRAYLPEDPYLLYATEWHSGEDRRENQLPDASDVMRDIISAADGLDLVGILASGPQYQGFANSLGQRNWFETASFNFDWSCHLVGDKAVKSSYAGFKWRTDELYRCIEKARAQLERLKQPSTAIKPGYYRAYLAPAALHEIFETLAEDGFSLKQHRTRQSPLTRLAFSERRLAHEINITENHRAGLAPSFTSSGFMKPPQVNLIQQGQYADCLAAPRSAREYGVLVNASSESPESLDMAGGGLMMAEALKWLDTGLYISNLWYCNFSERADCRITGMTRYACFWVEHGEIKAPVDVMRFDDSVYRMFGDKLIGLTREKKFRFDVDTYHRRSTRSMDLPGALLDDFNLTL